MPNKVRFCVLDVGHQLACRMVVLGMLGCHAGLVVTM